MAYCAKCGVEILSPVEECPLCGYRIDKGLLNKDLKQDYPEISQIQNSPLSSSKKILPLFTTILSSSFLIVIAINWFIQKKITWAVYPMAAIGFLWVVMLIFCVLKNLYLKIFYLSVAACAFIFIIDFLQKPVSWSIEIGIPIIFFCFVIVLSIIMLIKKNKYPALAAAWILFFICIICFGIDAILSFQISRKIISGWSIVVISALLPVVIYLLYFHYALKKNIDFKKIFHV